MKKITSILLAIILCLGCLALSPAEEIDGQSAIMDYIGTYDDIGTQRAVMTIEAIGQEEPYAHIVIRWSNSAEEYVEWDLTGLLDPETMTIVCTDGTKSLCAVNEAGNVTAVAENINIDSEFVIHDDESITWIDHAENAGENSRFVFSDGAWSFDDAVAEQDAEGSAFTANIDKYWQEHDIDGMMAARGNTEEALADIRAQMLAMYGENKEITGDYDEALAANTVSGTYVGQIVSDEVVSWKGIPYAKQPVGELRWKAPQAPDASDKVYEAYYFGHSSVQVEGGDEPSSLYPQGEDCLNLNLWNNFADTTENKPIMVWIHGGAYIQGGACTDEYDGTNFVKNHPDVIFASIDYRTDYLGFINLSNVPGAEDYKDTANLGLMDEIQALKWLRENAAAFGGDPERITIFGESAGGGSVSALMLAPQAKGMFKRGIMQSGVSTAYLRTAKKSIARTDKMMEISGAKNLDDLLSLTKTDIRKLGTIIVSESGLDYTYPQRDGIVIPMDIRAALNSDQRNGFDIMIGTTKNEYNYFTMILGREYNLQMMHQMIDEAYADANDDQKARLDAFMATQTADEYDNLLQFINYRSFHCPARYEAKTHAANGQNAYVYYFTEESNDPERLSDHGYDLGFVLGNVEEDRAKDILAAWKLSEIMQQMWVNFAKTGDPSLNEGEVEGVDAIRWDKYQADDYKVMVLDSQGSQLENDPIREGSDLLEDLFWLRIKDE